LLDWTVIVARFGQYAATLLLCGSALFWLYEAPAIGAAAAAAGGARRLLRSACALALLSCLVYLLAETASLTGAVSDAFDASSLWAVVSTTRFGALTAARILVLLLAGLGSLTLECGRPLWILESVLGGAVVASYAWTGHGALDDGLAGIAHLGADVLHLLAAALWVGALVPLARLLERAIGARTAADTQCAAQSLERFARIGPAVVGLLIASGIVNVWYVIGAGRWSALFTSPYGRMLLAKLAFFALMLLLAALNRSRLVPALRRSFERASSPEAALRRLRLSVASEATLAFLVLAAVAVLGMLEPPVSMS